MRYPDGGGVPCTLPTDVIVMLSWWKLQIAPKTNVLQASVAGATDHNWSRPSELGTVRKRYAVLIGVA